MTTTSGLEQVVGRFAKRVDLGVQFAEYDGDKILEEFLSEVLEAVTLPPKLRDLFKISKEYESILYVAVPRYRDHVLHAINVFLTGYAVLHSANNALCRWIERQPGQFDVDKSWVLASVFHDVGQWMDKVSYWFPEVYRKFLYPGRRAEGGLQWLVSMHDFASGEYRRDVEYLLDVPSLPARRGRREVQDCLARRLFEDQNHGIVSCLAVKHWLQALHCKVEDSTLYHAMAAMAFHDSRVWEGVGHSRAPQVFVLRRMPIAFLLAYCDGIQEWGRGGAWGALPGPSAAGTKVRGTPELALLEVELQQQKKGPKPTVCCELTYPPDRRMQDAARRAYSTLQDYWHTGSEWEFRVDCYCYGPSGRTKVAGALLGQ
ncbi:MAG: hypothetical protein WBF66_00195 [Dehalococcoidia bacterium]